jgi:hypothetical protein
MRYTKHRCDQTSSVEANLLVDGIDDTLVSVGPTVALHEISWPYKLALRNMRQTSDLRAVCWCGGRISPEPGGEMDTRVARRLG